MMRRLVHVPARLLASAAVALTLTQCGSSGGGGGAAPTVAPVAPSTTLLVTFGDDPTASAQMVCGQEGQTELADAFKVSPTQITTPSWVDHLYSCTYLYPDGSFTLSVKELPTIPDTVSYFAALKAKFTVKDPLALGQDGFSATDGTSVVRKDNMVLQVDVTKLSDQFGVPPFTRANASLVIASTLLGCWTGE